MKIAAFILVVMLLAWWTVQSVYLVRLYRKRARRAKSKPMTEDEKVEHRQYFESIRDPALPLIERLLMVVILSPIIVIMLPWYIYGAVGDPYDKQARA